MLEILQGWLTRTLQASAKLLPAVFSFLCLSADWHLCSYQAKPFKRKSLLTAIFTKPQAKNIIRQHLKPVKEFLPPLHYNLLQAGCSHQYIWKAPWFMASFCSVTTKVLVTAFRSGHVVQGNLHPCSQVTVSHIWFRINHTLTPFAVGTVSTEWKKQAPKANLNLRFRWF